MTIKERQALVEAMERAKKILDSIPDTMSNRERRKDAYRRLLDARHSLEEYDREHGKVNHGTVCG